MSVAPVTPGSAPLAPGRPRIQVEVAEKGRGKLIWASIAVHVVAGLAIGAAEVKKIRAATAIEIADLPAKPKETPPPPAPPPPAADPPKRPVNARPPEPSAAPPASDAPLASDTAGLDGLPDFGLSLSSGTGPGIPIAVGRRAAPPPPPTPKRQPIAARAATPVCSEPLIKPRAKVVPQPVYAEAARAAGVEGRVRVELSVDEFGKVSAVRLLAGLGHGLDEAVLAAARRAEFEPGRRCGAAVRSTFLLSMRFAASS